MFNKNMKKRNAPGSSNKRPAKRVKTSFVPRARFGEVKGVDTVLTLSPVIATTSTNGSIFTLNLIAPGTASYNRVGRKVYHKSVRIRGFATWQFAAATTTSDLVGNTLRMVLVWDKQPAGAVPAFDTIFGVTAQDGTESSTIQAPIKYDNMDRFKILKDDVYTFKAEATPLTGGSTNLITYRLAFDEYVKLLGKETVFSGQSATQTIADISSGGLYLVFRSLTNVATSSNVSIDSNSFARLRYTD